MAGFVIRGSNSIDRDSLVGGGVIRTFSLYEMKIISSIYPNKLIFRYYSKFDFRCLVNFKY